MLAAVTPLLLGGLLSLDPPTADHWNWAGAWQYPVGRPWDLLAQPADGVPAFKVLRGVDHAAARDSLPARGHQGADIGNGLAGSTVRAAANGLVVRATPTGENSGYGSLVVLAHRTPSGLLLYSVYAHLTPGSVRVHSGDAVGIGQPLGRVGRSGRASTNHLHFEVRRAGSPGDRWEHAHPIDPVLFVSRRLPSARRDTAWSAPCLIWAQCAGILPPEVDRDGPLDGIRWQSMLARAACPTGGGGLPLTSSGLRETLIRRGLLQADEPPPDRGLLEWRRLARDVARLRALDSRVVPPGLSREECRALCESHFGTPAPSDHPHELSRHARGAPTIAEACLALIDACARPVAESERSTTRR